MKKISKVLSLMLVCIIAIYISGCGTTTTQVKTVDYDLNESLCGARVCYFPIEDDTAKLDQAAVHQICLDYLDGNLDLTRSEEIDQNQNHLVIMAATLGQLDSDLYNDLANNRLRLVLSMKTYQGNTKEDAYLTTLSGYMSLYEVKRSIIGNDRLSNISELSDYDTMDLHSSTFAHYEVNLLYCFPANYTKGRVEDYYALSEEPIDAVSDTLSIQISKSSDIESRRKYICVYELLWREN